MLINRLRQCLQPIGMPVLWTIPHRFGFQAVAATLLVCFLGVACGNDQSSGTTTPPPDLNSTPPAVQQRTLAMGGPTAPSGSGASRLEEIRGRGQLRCATSDAIPGFGYRAADHNVGFDVDLCRAVAAAALGDANAVGFRISIPTGLGVAVRSGEVDMVARVLTATTTRDARWGNFVHTMYYDGQGFMVRRDLGASSARELTRASVCVTRNTTTELNLVDFSDLHRLDLRSIAFDKTRAAVEAYLDGQCDAFTTDHSGLHAYRSAFSEPNDHVILPDVISEEPLTPLVPHGDDGWYDIVKTVMAILIHAEAYGITSDRVPTEATGDVRIDRLFGLEGSFGQEDLGLSRTVAQDVIRAVGNYGEIYDRHLAPLGLERRGSRNALWSSAPCTECPKGGQIYAFPLR